MRRHKIFRVTFRNNLSFHAKAVDEGALNTLMYQCGLPKPEKVERVSGHSQEAMSVPAMAWAYSNAIAERQKARRAAIQQMNDDIDFQSYLDRFCKGHGRDWLETLRKAVRIDITLALHNAFLSGTILGMEKAKG